MRCIAPTAWQHALWPTNNHIRLANVPQLNIDHRRLADVAAPANHSTMTRIFEQRDFKEPFKIIQITF